MKLKAAPGKIVVKRLEEKARLKGGIELPVNRTKLYDIAEIVAVGDLTAFGFEGRESTVEPYKPGDIVLFQLPAHMAGLIAHEIKGVVHIFLGVPDILARLDKNVIALEHFHMAGRFILLEPTVRKAKDSLIIVPDTAVESNKESIHFSVIQTGADVKLDIFKGQEVFPHRGRVNPIVIDGKELAFVDQAFIDGVLAPD